MHSVMRTLSLRLFLSISAAAMLAGSTLFAQTFAQTPREELPSEAFTISLEEYPPLDPLIRAGEFDNGMRYYIRENSEPANRAELRLIVDAGSILEDDDQLGLAHFLEHMAFNGTGNFEKQELVAFMESIGMRLGPDINATTSFDETIYMLQLPTDDAGNLETAFQIMQDWATGLTLDAGEIELERGVVIEEWRRGLGAQGRIRDQQIPKVLKGSPYAERLPIGTQESLRSFDHAALRRFYDDWYRPELMGIVAVGDFDGERIETMIREHFADIPASGVVRERSRHDIPPHDETLFSIVTDPEVPITQVSLIHKQPAEYDWTVGGYRRSIVENLYHAILNTRFAEMTRETDPPFLAASSGDTSIVRPMSAYVMTAVVQEDGIDRALKVLLTEAESVKQFGFNQEELDRQKTTMLRAVEQAYANRDSRPSASLAAELMRVHLTGESAPGLPYELALVQRFMEDITLQEVNAVGRDWITDSNRVVTVIAPEKEGAQPPDEAHLLSVIASTVDAEVVARVEESDDRELLPAVPEGAPVVKTNEIDGNITEWILGNGVRVLVKPTDFRQDEIVFRAFSPGGVSTAGDENLIPAQTALAVIGNGGLGDFTAVELQRELAGKIANVMPTLGPTQEGLQGSGSPGDLETLMQLIYLRMTAPRADPTFYQVFQQQMRMMLPNRLNNPATVFEEEFNKVMTQNHPRRPLPSLEMLDGMDLEASLRFYEDRFGDAGDFTFVFVGSIDLDRLKPLVETYLGGLPASGREDNWVDEGVRMPSGVVKKTVRKGIDPQSSTRIVFSGEFAIRDRVERAKLQLSSLILEQRLRGVLREQLSGTYSVSANWNMIWEPVPSYTMTLAFGSDPQRVDELVEAIFAEIAGLRESGPTEQELADAKQALLRNYETGMETNANWLGQIQYAVQSGVQPLTQDIFGFPETLASITEGHMRQGFVDFLDTGNYVQMSLLPENR